MGIVFDRKYSDLDNPLFNLTLDKHFSEVVLLCLDEVIIFTTNEKHHKDHRDLGKKSVYGEDIQIDLYNEYLTWIENGKLNILPYSMISRWVIE